MQHTLKQIINWVALPNGTTNGRMRLSIFVAPRLEVGGAQVPGGEVTLDSFPDFQDWPQTVAAGLKFEVNFEGTGGSPQTVTLKEEAQPPIERRPPQPWPNTQNVWLDLLNDFPPVRSFSFTDSRERGVFSFSGKQVTDFLRSRYTKGRTPEAMTAGNLNQPSDFGRVASVKRNLEQLFRAADRQLQDQKAVKPEAPPQLSSGQQLDGDEWNLGLLSYYLTRQTASASDASAVMTSGGPTPKVTEFHQLISSLGEYPEVMRQLRLVIDLELPAGVTVPGNGRVSVRPVWLKPSAIIRVDATPWTRYAASGARFGASARHPDEIVEAMLALSIQPLWNDFDFVYDEIQIDPVAEGIKLIDFAADLASAPPERAVELPPLRSSGCALQRKNQVERVGEVRDFAIRHNAALGGGNAHQIELFAEDLTRGYRVDVQDVASGVWYSLCLREGEYHILKTGQRVRIGDEGWATVGASVSGDQLGIHDTLFRWDGWSLCAPRPGLALLPDHTLGEGDTDAAAYNKLVVTFTPAPRTLPRLRFGRRYRFRVRLADLAGNGPRLSDTPAAASAVLGRVFTYGRMEPVASPFVLLNRDVRDSPGESVDHLVIRSNYDTPAAEDCQRHIVAPKATQALAESHGMFDTASGLDPAAYDIAKRDGTLEQVYESEDVTLPYLPDPLAKEAVLRGLPGSPPDCDSCRLKFMEPVGNWPSAASWRLRIQEGPFEQFPFDNPATVEVRWPAGVLGPNGQPLRSSVDRRLVASLLPAAKRAEYEQQLALVRNVPTRPEQDGRVLRVSLPKAAIVEVQLGCGIAEDDLLKTMGIWHDIAASGVSSIINEIKAEILKGRDSRFTPHRTLTLVHAVQQPLFEPQFQFFLYGQETLRAKSRRGASETSAEILCAVSFPGASADRLDIDAAWRERVDDPLLPEPHVVEGSQHFLRLTVGKSDAVLPVAHRHEFRDTKHRRVVYAAVATSRFRGYFDPAAVESGALPTTRRSEPVEVVIDSSERPPAPDVAYVIPLFGWGTWNKNPQNERSISRKRHGGGLRVYLRRPWLTSGEGELLAVVLNREFAADEVSLLGMELKPTVAEIDAATKEYTSRWGSDPVWRRSPAPSPPSPNTIGVVGQSFKQPEHFMRAEHFRNNVDIPGRTEFSLPELKNVTVGSRTLDDGATPNPTVFEVPIRMDFTVKMAAYEVKFDATRGMWYSDIFMTSLDSPQPFVRLALARYQPHSVEGQHLSPVALADFVQLAPDRSVTFVRGIGAASGDYEVTVSGKFHPDCTPSAPPSTRFEVTIETRDQNSGAGEGDEFEWRIRGTHELSQDCSDPQAIFWKGRVSSVGGAQTRFRVNEFEEYESDDGLVRRLVFTDVLCL